MTARLSAFMVWALLAASAVFWGLRLAGSSPVAPPHTVPVSDAIVPHADLTRLFGAEPVAQAQETPPESSRFHLIGVVAPRASGSPAVALISVDNKPARPYRMGAVVDGDNVLLAVEPRAASLGPRGGAATVRLELPAVPPPSTGALPPPPPLSGDAAEAGQPVAQPVPVPMQPAAPVFQPQGPAGVPQRAGIAAVRPMAPVTATPGGVVIPPSGQPVTGAMNGGMAGRGASAPLISDR